MKQLSVLGSYIMKNPNRYYKERIRRLQKRLKESQMSGVILVPGPNLRYYTGSQSIMMERIFMLFVPRDAVPHLVVPDFEAGEFMESGLMVHKWNDRDGPSRALREVSDQLSMKKHWGLEGRVPFRFLRLLMKYANPKFVDAEPILERMRVIKDDVELGLLRRSATTLGRSYLKISEFLRSGATENDLAGKLTADIYSNGAESVFAVSVQAGERAAEPHSPSSSRKMRRDEPVVIDIASTYLGYFADITRTVAIGRGARFEDLYCSVLAAQEEAIEILKPGVTVASVDAAARTRLRKDKLADYFLTRTGHGIGLDVHEAPYLVAGGTQTLQSGMVHTIEPGVYIHGELGIRIEDDVLITATGHRSISSAVPKTFGWWN